MDDRPVNAAQHSELYEVLPSEFKRWLTQPTCGVGAASASDGSRGGCCLSVLSAYPPATCPSFRTTHLAVINLSVPAGCLVLMLGALGFRTDERMLPKQSDGGNIRSGTCLFAVGRTQWAATPT